MKNTDAICALLRAADTAHDPLDRLACQRAAAWIRWCDGFGATITNDEASVMDQTHSLGEVSRMIVARFSSLFPALPEDADLRHLDEEGSGWQDEFRRQAHQGQALRIDDPFDSGPK